MFNKRKQHSARSAQSTWQEPRVSEPAPSEAESGKDAAPHEPQAAAPSAPSSPAAGPKPAPRPDASAVLNRQPTPPVRPDATRRAGGANAPSAGRAPENADAKKLTVGRDISLAGEIRTCDTLVVEGTVEAELNDTQLLDIQQSGLFKGTAVVDTAEIAGRFEGELTVRKRLYVRATGNVHGTIKYRGLEIESGGRIGGTLTELSEEEAQAATASKPSQPAAGRPNGAASPTLAASSGGGEH